MEIGQVICTNKGMFHDTSIGELGKLESGETTYAYENHNIRIMPVNDNTKFSVTNEKSTVYKDTITGTYLGSCKLNNYLVLFIKDTTNQLHKDFIYRLEYDGTDVDIVTLYEGNLGFDFEHPIEAVGYYESEEIQKVYWVDGKNPNRFINIVTDSTIRASWNDTSFDFQGTINNIPNVTIEKDYSINGNFIAGTLLYFMTYYNKYGIETCIIWNSDLQYISLQNRGAKPDESVTCAFKFHIDNIDTNYEYLRIYSCYRSNINGTSDAKIVTDIKLDGTLTSYDFIDIGYNGETINALDLPYTGGLNIIANTLDYKQDTMFFGNIKLPEQSVLNVTFLKTSHYYADLQESILESNAISWKYKLVSTEQPKGVYTYTPEITKSQKDVAGYKWREVYRFGIQFMTNKGEWTSAYWIGDKYCNLKPVYHDINEDALPNPDFPLTGYYIAEAIVDYSQLCSASDILKLNKNYKAYRLLVADTNISNRRIVEQGVICPTMFNYYDRVNNKPWAIPAWSFRPRLSNLTNRHYDTLPLQSSPYAELQGIVKRQIPGFNEHANQGDSLYDSYLLILGLDTYKKVHWKLIYYHSGNDDDEKVNNIALLNNNSTTQVYDKDYKVVSSGYIKEKTWDLAASTFVSQLQNDLKAAGEEVIFSQGMFPSGDLMKDLANLVDSNTQVAQVVLAAIAVAVSAIATIFSAGAAASLTALGAMALSSALATMTLAGAAGTAVLANNIDPDDLSDIDKEMISKGFLCWMEKHTNGRNGELQKAKYKIYDLLEKYFTGHWNKPKSNPDAYYQLNEDIHPDVFLPTGVSKGYNWYTLSGSTTKLNQQLIDSLNKQNLFCTDESIVTLNSPTVEENNYAINNSDALKLDLVGIIPIHSVHGEYIMQTERGLNSQSQVIPNQFKDSPMVSTDIEGLLNGNLYQDCDHIDENSIFPEDEEDNPIYQMQVNASAALYRTFMWNRDTSVGLNFPSIKLISELSTDEDNPIYVDYKSAKLVHKIFANLRYSKNTEYQNPFTINIEQPQVCLDNQPILKALNYFGDTKFYYLNVDTISVNKDAYPLFIDNASFPALQKNINKAELKDPVHIKYKVTPNVVIPFKYDALTGKSIILPITNLDKVVTPDSLYGDEVLGYALQGANNIIAHPYIYNLLETLNNAFIWTEGTVTQSDLVYLLRNTDIEISSAITAALTHKTTLDTDGDWLLDTNNTNMLTYILTMFYSTAAKKKRYLISSPNGFYHMYFIGNNWVSKQITAVITGSTHTQPWEVLSASFVWNSTTNYGEFTFDFAAVFRPVYYYIYNNNKTFRTALTNPMSFVSHIEKFIYEGAWAQPTLGDWNVSKTPYLFIGELVLKVFDYSVWNGGTSDYALQQLTWNVASNVTEVNTNINNTWGDTFYQRWDCQKTYPYTEEDTNSVVDVLSFMLESHNNIDGRCDINRGINNLINLRPTNTMYNNAYSQKDNFFSYKTLDEKFNKTKFEADVVWSLTKNNVDNIDRWTNLIAMNEMSLDGKYGPVNKILNVNNNLITFQDKSISTIKYNEDVALNTTAGLPVQLGNTLKVTGYRIMSDTVGCHNKYSIIKTSAGTFFIDDFNRTFNAIDYEKGLLNLGLLADFSQWFKNNISGTSWNPINKDSFISSYDETTHDLYIINNEICLVYNVLLLRFTSFMDYTNTPIITNLTSITGKSSTFAVRNNIMEGLPVNITEIHELFAGDTYGYIYEKFCPYSIEYRISPNPQYDSIFTNYCYNADWTDPVTKAEDDHLFDTDTRRFTTFDSVEAKNEYQQGVNKIITDRIGVFKTKAKFRIWRGDIPRDGDTETAHSFGADRMRNPWIHLKFTKKNPDDSKMTFYNLTITYYNQYGSI